MTADASARAGGAGVLFVQTGDFLGAATALGQGKPETYRDQSRSIDHVIAMARHRPVTVVSRTMTEPYVATVQGVRCVGLSDVDFFGRRIADVIRAEQRELAIVRSPLLPVLGSLIDGHATILCTFADVFSPPRGLWPPHRRLRGELRRARLAQVLRHPRIVAVGNHGRFATRSLTEVMHLPPDRAIPWEWTRVQPDPDAPTRPPRVPGRIAYAGVLSEEKGVGDLLQAMALVLQDRPDARLDVFGEGNARPALQALAGSLGLSAAVTFRGAVPNTDVRRAFAAASAVVVPSRHVYPEGVPNVIFEALAEATPLVITDHPAFSGNFRNGETALIVSERDPAALSRALHRLWTEPDLAARLSAASGRALDSLYLGPSWYDLIDSFVDDPANRSAWVERHSLATLLGDTAPRR